MAKSFEKKYLKFFWVSKITNFFCFRARTVKYFAIVYNTVFRNIQLVLRTTFIYKKSNIGCYIENCSTYEQKYEEFCASNLIDFKTLKQKKDHFLKQYFFILRKGFRSKFDRLKHESDLIRLKRPTLNDQFDHKKIKLFWHIKLFNRL